MDNDEGRLKIIDESKNKSEKKERLKCGQIVYCKGIPGIGDFYGIVYEYGVLEIPFGSTAYIYTRKPIYLGDTINYWTIEKAYKKVKLIVEE